MSYIFKADLAARYFPFVSRRSAMRLLRAEIQRRKDLYDELLAAGYTVTSQRFSPKEVAIIANFLGDS